LFSWYRELGGVIELRELSKTDLPILSSPLVNCGGLSGSFLFEQTDKVTVQKGHLVLVNNAPLIRNSSGQTISYNYNPKPEVYADREGNPMDVYCYPRSDGWILGGSRLTGTYSTDEGLQESISADSDTTQRDEYAVPLPIFDLNRSIIRHSYGIHLDNYPNQEVLVGYRHTREEQGGLRVDREQIGDQVVIHNYGHGGAGVTLSWGCALRVAGLLSEHRQPARTPGVIQHPALASLAEFLDHALRVD
ncbi:MAG: FAD-dependent oxidoreductase, partial [Balneolaceae bacterium]|nr:FAD-dependent oxidoreductase [Balneolaceae bacterium]